MKFKFIYIFKNSRDRLSRPMQRNLSSAMLVRNFFFSFWNLNKKI